MQRLRTVKGVRTRSDGCQSHFEATNASTRFPCHADPSKNSVLEDLVEEHVRVTEREMSRHLSANPGMDLHGVDEDGDLLFPMAWMEMPDESDGKPAGQIRNLRQKAAAVSTAAGEACMALGASAMQPGLVQFPGGFHVYKTMTSDVGLHGECISGPLAWTFLGSIGRLGYFQDPSDPRVPLSRWRQVVWATLCCILVCAETYLGHKVSCDEAEQYVKLVISLSPVADAWWHVLLDLQTIFALIDCETAGETGDFSTYNRILIFANLMFVRCGNTTYFPMMSEFILYYCCCSDAEWIFTA